MKEAAVSKAGDLLSDLLYGLINAIVGIPTMISFAAIIFSVRLWTLSNLLCCDQLSMSPLWSFADCMFRQHVSF